MVTGARCIFDVQGRDMKQKCPRRTMIVSGVDSQCGIDSVQNISEYNDGGNYLLIAIDMFSKFLFVHPLKGHKV